MYSIKNTEENFKKLEEVIEERKFIIYRKILYVIETCQIIEEDSYGIIIEIDLIEHHQLLVDLTNSFFTKKICTRKVEKKIGHSYFVGNPFLAIKNLQWFLEKFVN